MNLTAVRIPWPDWEAVKFLGGGSFGKVYEIRRKLFDAGDEERAAVKVIRVPKEDADAQELISSGYEINSINERYLRDLQDIAKEYSMMAKLKGNANIVYCDDIYYEQNPEGIGWTLYIRMELLTPLNKGLSDPIRQEQVIKLGMDLCNALAACKKNNIIHRDIKPANIMVASDGNYKLGDFGVAKTTERTAGGTKTGTYNYMAPEVYNNKPYGLNADIYSLGMVMYWMLNQRCGPFLPLPPTVPSAMQLDEAKQRRFDGDQLPPPANGSDQLKKIVLKACAYDPTQRYDSPEALYADLAKLQLVPEADDTVSPSEELKLPPVGPGTDAASLGLEKDPFDDDNSWEKEYEKTMGSDFSGKQDDGGTVGGGSGSDNLGPYDLRGEIALTQQELDQGCVKPFTTGSGETVNVTVKPGSTAGTVLCVEGAGKQDAATGTKGNAYVTLTLRNAVKKDAFGEAFNAEVTISPEEAKKGCSKLVKVNDKGYLLYLPANLTDMQVVTVDAKTTGGVMDKLTVRVRIEESKEKKKPSGCAIFMLLLGVVLLFALPPVGIGLLALAITFLCIYK